MTPQWAWATHQPLIQSLLDLYFPSFVLEVGVGFYSTPLFVDEDIEYVGIDQDELWITKIREKFPELDLRHHNVAFNSAFRPSKLTNKQVFDVVSYYNKLRAEIEEKEGVKVLFVDCFTATRMYAINCLWDLFDIIIYHDSHPRARKIYGYDRLKPVYNQYHLTSRYSWTSAYVKEDIGKQKLQKRIDKYIKSFESNWGVKTGMQLV